MARFRDAKRTGTPAILCGWKNLQREGRSRCAWKCICTHTSLYQKELETQSTPGSRGARGIGPTGGRDRMDSGAIVALRTMPAPNATNSRTPVGAAVARSADPGTGFGVALCAVSRSLSSLRTAGRRHSLGGPVAADYASAGAGDPYGCSYERIRAYALCGWPAICPGRRRPPITRSIGRRSRRRSEAPLPMG